jgi:hypothetical protein
VQIIEKKILIIILALLLMNKFVLQQKVFFSTWKKDKQRERERKRQTEVRDRGDR